MTGDFLTQILILLAGSLLVLSLVRRFRLPAWQETVLRKQRLLAEVNDLIGDAVSSH